MKTTPRILYVDDHKDTLLIVSLWLGGLGYDVVTAESPAEGLRLARSKPFDLYLLDSRFAGGSGAELCENIREFDETTPIIFYSGDHPSRLKETEECDAQGFVMKPGIESLPQEIKRALRAA